MSSFVSKPFGELPADWTYSTVGKNVDFATGPAFDSSNFNDLGIGYKLVRGINLTRGVTRWDSGNTKYWNDSTNEYKKFELQVGDVVVGMDGSLVGKNYAQISNKDLPALLVQRVARLRCKESLDQRFLYYAFASDSWISYVEIVKTNSGIPHISNGDIKDFSIPFPIKSEQQKIASILTAVDEVIASTTAQINKLKDLKTGMMQELLTKGIGHTEFKDSPVGWIPKAWEVVQADSVCSKITKGTTPPKSDYVEDGKIPFLRVNNLSFDNKIHFENGVLFLSREIQDGVLARSRVYPGDILMNIVGPPLGKVAIVPDIFVEYNVNQAIIIYRSIENKINNKYLLHYLTSNMAQDWFQTQSKKTSGQQNLTIEVCKDLHIPMPPLDEQDAIVRMLDSIHAKFSLATRKHSAYAELKKSLMQDLLTGKVRVNS